MSKPKVGTILTDDDGCEVGYVVNKGATSLACLIHLLESQQLMKVLPLDNPILVAEAEKLEVEEWRSVTKRMAEAEGWDYRDRSCWAPHGDGKRSIWVLVLDRPSNLIADEIDEDEFDRRELAELMLLQQTEAATR